MCAGQNSIATRSACLIPSVLPLATTLGAAASPPPCAHTRCKRNHPHLIMKGTRPLDNTEIRQVTECFDGTFAVRSRSLFVLGVSTGGRISELLSLKVGDVWQNRAPVTDLLFDRSIVKGGKFPEPCQSILTADRLSRPLSAGILTTMGTSRTIERCFRRDRDTVQ